MASLHDFPIQCIILAAGKSTRMKSSLPKVFHEIAGQPMLFHVLDTCTTLKCTQNIVVLNPEMNDYHKTITTKQHDITICVQDKQLGTAHAVQSALPHINDENSTTLILYGDTPLISSETLTYLLEQQTDLSLLVFETYNPHGYGRIIINDNDFVSEIIEQKDLPPEQESINLCNSGVIAIKTTILKKLISHISNKNAAKEYYLTDIVKLANDHNYNCGYVVCHEAELIGVNDRLQLAQAEQLFQTRLVDRALSSGVTFKDPNSVQLSFDTTFEQDVIIDPHVVISKGVSIDSGTHIKAFSHLEGVTIGKNCTVGPFARLRPGTNLHHDVRIGNFVEVKNADIDSGSKVNHLSYVGDSTIATDVNIGAGVITCNYDGKNKHRTTIGKGAFIGSNSALVAPVTIGSNTVVAAGSTITENVEEDRLVIARSKQTIKEKKKK